ncbi:hypothetical protein AY601_5045 [Pedobacter cryoconitis]|uniref:Uncharacterized protein n=1 Tax=Pedobacter cryoconitis TaxID=188932 RepID=A0A127VKR3_9SPHI|nr:hypothetical protein [Pedobacter cryoconitis]AMQ01858.1 hypothetical protein AY601_5045 [Pedobacter cryoconitis]
MENNLKKAILPALIDTLLILVFTVQPTIWLSLNFWRKGQIATLGETLLSGDVLLYGISFLSASYLVYNQTRVKESDWKDILNKIIVCAMIIISMLYAMMKADNETNITFAKYVSIIVLIFSLISFVISQVLVRRPTTDVAEERREEQQIIEDNLV